MELTMNWMILQVLLIICCMHTCSAIFSSSRFFKTNRREPTSQHATVNCAIQCKKDPTCERYSVDANGECLLGAVTNTGSNFLEVDSNVSPDCELMDITAANMLYSDKEYGMKIRSSDWNEYDIKFWDNLTSVYSANLIPEDSGYPCDAVFYAAYDDAGWTKLARFQGENVHYADRVSSAVDVEMSGYPKLIGEVFVGQAYPVDAADRWAKRMQEEGAVYILKGDDIREYDVVCGATIDATFTATYSVTSTTAHTFNAIPQSPPQMPRGITALHTNKYSAKSVAFVGAKMYIHEWGTGTWNYIGLVCQPAVET